MSRKWSLLLGVFLIFFVSASARAAEPVPGDACSTANVFLQSGGVESGGKVYFMTCQGGVWVNVFTTDTTGRVGFGTTAPGALLALSGGQMMVDDNGSTGAQGCIKYNGGTSKLQYSHDCSSYSDMGGGGSSLWTTGAGDDIYYNTGTPQVGIGTASPAATLDVAGRMILDDGQDNMFITGGNDTTTAVGNVSIGTQALDSLSGTCTGNGGNDCDYNVAIGYSALTASTTGYRNVAIGTGTGAGITTGDSNVAIGYQALQQGTAVNNNMAIGYQTLQKTTGNANTAFGSIAMRENKDGHDNVAVGYNAGKGATNASPDYSVFLGAGAGLGIDTGQYNVFIGYQAGDATTTGGSNILIGNGVDAPAAGTNNFLNIGNVIYASGLYNTGNVGINNASPNVALDVIGDIEFTGTITDVSDRRMKKDIENLPAGQLEKIMALQGMSFRMKDDPKNALEFGFIAQDVEPLYPELVNTAKDEIGTKSLNYLGLIAPMVEAMKQQQAEIEALKAEVEVLKAQVQQ